MTKVVIVAAGRTPVGKFLGSLSKFSAVDLGAHVISNLMKKVPQVDPSSVDEVIMGQILTAGCGQHTARQASLKGGLPIEVPSTTINKLCGSGLKSVALAAQAILAGDAEIVVAGGQESMTNAAFVLPGARQGFRMGHTELQDTMIKDALTCGVNGYHMGMTAENLAAKYEITREEQDAFALASQQKAKVAIESGRFDDEIFPVEVPQGKGKDPVIFARDEHNNPKTTAESLAAFKPAFKKDGSVTAGNASGINDGAAGVIVMSEAKAKELGLPILAYVKAYASAGVDPAIMGYGPVPATQACLKKAGWSLSDLDLIEANEAFAAQSLSVAKGLGFGDAENAKLNVNGGAIALGHPVGASGARVLVSLIFEMIKRDAKKGLATLCIGAGMGISLAIERP